MSLEAALWERLTERAAISALVGARVYPEVAPQNAAYPRITFSVLTTDTLYAQEGASGLVDVDCQLDVWAATSVSRRAVVESVRDAMSGYTGLMGSTTALDVRACFLDGPAMSFERPIDGTDVPTYRGRLSLEIWHVETAPTL